LFGEFLRIDYKLSMPKTPKPEEDEKRESWADDQKDREYYYDDAHGYEKYEPASEEDNGDEDNTESTGSKRAGASPPSPPANFTARCRLQSGTTIYDAD
jgi:hypothetical protein